MSAIAPSSRRPIRLFAAASLAVALATPILVRAQGVPEGLPGLLQPEKVRFYTSTQMIVPGNNAFNAITNLGPIELFSGKAYTIKIRVQTLDPNASTDEPGPPSVPGPVVFDAYWLFSAGGGADGTFVSQSSVATITLDPIVHNDKTVTIRGTVPVPPRTTNGLHVAELNQLLLQLNPATTAQFRAGMIASIEVTQ